VFKNSTGTVYYLSGTTGWSATFGGLKTSAVNYNSNGFNWAVTNNIITITGYTGSSGAVVIPSTIFGLPVTTIGSNGFQNKSSITSVTIPASVTSIGSSAFNGCSRLTRIYCLGNAPTIGTSVFGGVITGTVYHLSGTTGWTATFGGLTCVVG